MNIRIYGTEIKAICPIDGELKTFSGPNIKSPSRQLAHEYCQNHGLGYCQILDEIVAEIPCKRGSYEPDWDNMIDYENINSN